MDQDHSSAAPVSGRLDAAHGDGLPEAELGPVPKLCPICNTPYPGEGVGCPVCLLQGALESGAPSEGGPAAPEIQIGSIESRQIVSTGLEGEQPIYSSGYILFSRGSSLVARPFDAAARRVKGNSVTLAGDVSSFSASTGGVLAHASAPRGQLTWLDSHQLGRSLVGCSFPHTAYR